MMRRRRCGWSSPVPTRWSGTPYGKQPCVGVRLRSPACESLPPDAGGCLAAGPLGRAYGISPVLLVLIVARLVLHDGLESVVLEVKDTSHRGSGVARDQVDATKIWSGRNVRNVT